MQCSPEKESFLLAMQAEGALKKQPTMLRKLDLSYQESIGFKFHTMVHEEMFRPRC